MPGACGAISVHILVADDDHPLFVGALRAVVEPDPRYEIVGVAAEGDEVVRLAEELSPDIVLLDEKVAHRESTETRRLARTNSAPRVLVLTGAEPEHPQLEAKANGANAFVRRPRSARDFLETLKVVTLLVDPLAAEVAEAAAQASAANVSEGGVDRRP